MPPWNTEHYSWHMHHHVIVWYCFIPYFLRQHHSLQGFFPHWYSCSWCPALIGPCHTRQTCGPGYGKWITVAPFTRRVYGAGINKYAELCRILKQPCCPALWLLLCRYIVYLAKSNISHNTIKVYSPSAPFMSRDFTSTNRKLATPQASCGVVSWKWLLMHPSILRH